MQKLFIFFKEINVLDPKINKFHIKFSIPQQCITHCIISSVLLIGKFIIFYDYFKIHAVINNFLKIVFLKFEIFKNSFSRKEENSLHC